ncbi:(2Fe-2S) ferredoxin domain-containing protein [Myxosarcina sp. GI1]|uniref:(2Fe-2S) ferredoxin domain-containing protein n=1 Tax=Myxosarcina sp. GI1 TaxID=1541065 RepID=UPI00056A14A1|nr:(2Fe-2S) ferredoxin domain-containing protein [Myxosarcina sp. GI1]
MVTIQPLVSEFTITGKLEDLTISNGDRVKYLQLSTEAETYSIKVAKEKKRVLSQHLKPGCWLKAIGMRKCKLEREEFEYIAYRIELLAEPVSEQLATQTAVATAKPKAKVLFCQNSTCWKKGGKAVCELLTSELQAKGIADRVEIKTTGCLKQCKQAPNMVIMPGGIRHSRVRPTQVPTFIEHFL